VLLLTTEQHDKPKSLLSGGVPDLQFDDLTSDIDELATKLNTDSMRRILLNCGNTAALVYQTETVL